MKIDIGCGANKKPEYLGVDKTPGPAVDFVINFEADRLPFGDDTVEAIYSSHCIEHLSDPHLLLSEMLRVGRNGAPVELWLPYLKSNDAFVFGHRMFYNELIVTRIAATAPDFWFSQMEGVMQLDRVVYVLKPGITDELQPLGIPLPFAIKHLFNIVLEWGMFFTLRKGVRYRDRSEYKTSVQPPAIFVANSRNDVAKALSVPPNFWEMR